MSPAAGIACKRQGHLSALNASASRRNVGNPTTCLGGVCPLLPGADMAREIRRRWSRISIPFSADFSAQKGSPAHQLLDLVAAQAAAPRQLARKQRNVPWVQLKKAPHRVAQRGLVVVRLEQVAVLIRDARVRYLPLCCCVPA